MPARPLRWLPLAALILCRAAAAAEDGGPWALCPPPSDRWPQPAAVPEAAASAPETVRVWADRAEADRAGHSRFSGDVVVRQDGRQLEAQRADYERSTDEVHAQTGVRFFQNGLTITSTSADVNLGTNRGLLDSASYRFAGRHASGDAQRVHLEGEQRMRLDDATYTTCPPEHVDWLLRASRIDLDEASGQGSANNVVLRFKDVPFLYLPYIRFPISDRRMSGFLFPNFGLSEKNGTELVVPYYFNIAPNQDDTLTPRYMSRRGLMLDNEYRYLTQNSSGQINATYLPNDRVYGDDRAAASWRHSSRVGPGWSSYVDYNYVSDPQYLYDFGNDLETSNVDHLNRRAELTYNSRDWVFNTRVQDYQTLRGTDPYQMLPALSLASRGLEDNNALNYSFTGQAVRFADGGQRPVGTRVDLRPAVSFPMRHLAGYAVPQLALDYASYQLDDTTAEANTTPARALPIFSLDSGLYFERDTRIGGTPLIQTLEPRLYYLYTPYRDQSALPVFDTAAYDFGVGQLFRNYRFSGPDRIGDANQLTTAVTTRLLRADTGREVADFSLGQIQYFADRRVTLDGTPETASSSDLVAALGVRPNPHLALVAELQWDPQTNRTDVGGSRISYLAGNGGRLSLSHRYRRGRLETAEAAAAWPITPRWRALARWQYSLRDDATLERLAGFEYGSCCWGLQFMAREYVTTDFENPSKSFFVVLQLKGLSSLGDSSKIEQVLERGILGYRD